VWGNLRFKALVLQKGRTKNVKGCARDVTEENVYERTIAALSVEMSIHSGNCFESVCQQFFFISFSGYLQQAQVWRDEEGVRVERAVRLRDCPHHLQLFKQAVPVRVDRHGQGAAQVYRVQRAARVAHKQKHYRRE
jgi:hypothetical protein